MLQYRINMTNECKKSMKFTGKDLVIESLASFKIKDTYNLE